MLPAVQLSAAPLPLMLWMTQRLWSWSLRRSLVQPCRQGGGGGGDGRERRESPALQQLQQRYR